MRRIVLSMFVMVLSATFAFAETITTTAQTQKEEAERIINRFIGGANSTLSVEVNISLEADNGKDKFSYQLTGNNLSIQASSGVAACRGFYDFVKSNGAGICSWTGNRFEMPASPTTTQKAVQTSPYRDHQYFNVVTYGYTTPYWDEERWDKEIDWMALHGIDMPLMLVAAEAIYRRVFTQAPFNLTEDEVNAWEVGPAHLPWFRMGNLSGNSFDGYLGTHWNQRQIALAHHILDRMRLLGMKPVCPAFGGFVPQALANKYPNQFSYTGWNWVPQSYRNYRLNPDTDAFVEVGTRFIQEWEREFGECTYYLSDSFNEMTVPDDLDVLTTYGDHVYKCIKEGSSNPNSVWVTQGWTFVYQAGEWGKAKFNALTKNVDKHRFNMLYMSPEYGNGKWNTPYEGFNGHDWTITMLPNMGGKNFYNGGLTTYAGNWRTQYTGSNCDNLTGWGLTPEGVENNEMVYELICDAGWTPASQAMDVAAWKRQYASSRYGAYNSDVQAFFTTLQSTVLSSYQDHRCFGWQGYNKTNGYVDPRIDPGETFYTGMETFLSADNLAKYRTDCPELLRYDLIEAAAFYAGCRVEKLNKRIKAANNAQRKDEARALVTQLESVMTKMDRLLTAHPLYDEQKWEDKAARMAGANTAGTVAADDSERARYVKNARRIVSLWYGDHGTAANSHEAVNDYACRTWAGLIRDYYLPRLVKEWGNIIDGQSNNLRTVEHTFINASSLSDVESLETATDAELIDYIVSLVQEAKEAGDFSFEHVTDIQPSTDAASHWYAIRSAGANFNLRVMTTTPDLDGHITSTLTAEDMNGTTSQYWRFVRYGDTYRIENRNGMSMSYNTTSSKPVTYLANIDADIKMILHGKAGVDAKSDASTQDCWGLLPMVIANNTNTGYHMNGSQGLMVWNHEVNNLYYGDTSWSIEEVSSIGETYDEDYARFRRRLTGFQTERYGDASLIGKVGQPKTASSIATAITALGSYSAGDHETYDAFLADKWSPLWAEAITLPSSDRPNACKLFDLIVSAFQMPESSVNDEANEELAAALRAAQTTLASDDLTEAQAATAFTTLQTAIKAFVANYDIAAGSIKNGTWTLESWKTADADHTSCFPEAAHADFSEVQVAQDNSVVWVEMKYTNGSHRQDTYGVELLNAYGDIVYADYHSGNTGGSHNYNTYQVTGVKAGTYKVRCWSACRANGEDLTSTGEFTVKVNDQQVKTANWTKQTWMIDNTKLVSPTLRAMYNKVGGGYYKYMETQVKVPACNVAVTYTYTGGNERIDLIGVEVLDAQGNVVSADGHFGYTGNSHSLNTYNVKVPAQGVYTIRTWANYVRPFGGSVAGNITYEVTDYALGNHEPFVIRNPIEADGGDGRGTLALYTGNDNTGTDAPIAVDLVKYPGYTHGSWPTSSTAANVCTAWAKYTSAKGNTYIYNVLNGRFLATDNSNHVVFNDVPTPLTIKTSGDYNQIANAAGRNLCFTPGWGQNQGYYALWQNENRSDLCALWPAVYGPVSASIKAVVEKEVELAEAGNGTYVGDYGAEATAEAVATLNSRTGTRTAEACASLSVSGTRIGIDPAKYYVIESAINPNIWMYQNADNGYKMRYANRSNFDKRFVFRFVEAGTENSTNWGGSKEYPTYYIYCVGSTQQGYINCGAWNSAVTTSNRSDAKAYKVAEVDGNIYNISAKYSDNCTLSIGNGVTSVGDGAQGEIVSWNIYNSKTLANTWRIREVEAPEAFALETVNVSAAGAATYYFAKEVAIPDGVVAKYLTVADANATQTSDPGIYTLTYKRHEDVIPSGSAVVLIAPQGTYTFKSTLAPADYVTSAPASDANLLFGYTAETANPYVGNQTAGIYALAQPEGYDVGFFPFVGANFKAKKAYLDARNMPGINDGELVRGFMIMDTTTDGVTSVPTAPTRGFIYDLSGRRLTAPTRGVNVINGRKVMVK